MMTNPSHSKQDILRDYIQFLFRRIDEMALNYGTKIIGTAGKSKILLPYSMFYRMIKCIAIVAS
jgi:hypothetical protein